ncbi:MAG: gliding motility-associated C-terminal domain-containing protein, partial [Bacteroidota bacterium]
LGCEATAQAEITQPNVFIQIPSGITPDGDGVNDVWEIGGIEIYPNAIVKVFNQWESVLFESVGYTTPWDGTNDGSPLSTGSYFYIIDLNDSQIPDDQRTYSGSITIIK